MVAAPRPEAGEAGPEQRLEEIAEAGVPELDAVALGAIVLLTTLVALRGGFVGEGMMLVNQAAALAILVLTLRRPTSPAPAAACRRGGPADRTV